MLVYGEVVFIVYLKYILIQQCPAQCHMFQWLTCVSAIVLKSYAPELGPIFYYRVADMSGDGILFDPPPPPPPLNRVPFYH